MSGIGFRNGLNLFSKLSLAPESDLDRGRVRWAVNFPRLQAPTWTCTSLAACPATLRYRPMETVLVGPLGRPRAG
jgi:hypothetical protein